MIWPFSLLRKPKPTPKPIENLVTDVFSEAKGWRDEPGWIEVMERGHHHKDGNPLVFLKVGDIDCLVFQQTQEFASATPGAEPFRWEKICMVREIDGLEVGDPSVILRENSETHGYPCIGADEEGRLSLHMAFPVVQGMPLDAVRAQLKMAAVVIYDAELAIVNASATTDRGRQVQRPSFDIASFAKQAAFYALATFAGGEPDAGGEA